MRTNLFNSFFFFAIFLSEIVYPQQSDLSKSVNSISDYLASNDFLTIKNEVGDLKSVDSIYVQSNNCSNHNHSEVLLALTFTCVPYKEVPIQIPLLKVIFNYPLISATDSIFLLKNGNLPRYIFFDSPTDNYGDKDKLAHFFGSAFISYSSNIFDLGNPIGYFVEVFEETFKVQSKVDERDLETNQLGNIFGKLLKKNRNLLPSQILLLRTLSKIYFNL